MIILDKGELEVIDYMGSDQSIVTAARVSYNKANAESDRDKDKKLINYLWKNKHTSPFESVTFTFYVKAPIFVLRQWHRHRTQSYNEVSARYTELPGEFYIPDPSYIGKQSAVNKQARIIEESETDLIRLRTQEVDNYKVVCEAAFIQYKELLLSGWPRELARSVLPVSTYSKMFVSVNLLNLFRFLTLRISPHAQFEIREYAEGIVELIQPIVPIATQAWLDNI